MSEDDRFLNPYNFVRYLTEGKEDDRPEIKLLGRCAPPPHDRFVGLTGRIECELEAVTPIFVSNSEFVYKDSREHKSYEFFKLMDKNGQKNFAIPSTTLRGILRSVFEAATNSCFSIFDGGVLGKRERPENYDRTTNLIAGLILETPKSKDRPGQVKEMTSYQLPHRDFPRYRNMFQLNGTKILVKITNRKVIDVKEFNEENSEGYVEGYLKTSDKGIPGQTQKRNEYVFVDHGSSTNYELSYDTYQNYIIANRNNRQDDTKYPKPGHTIWFRPEKNQKKVKEFGYAQIYRKPFSKSIGELLPEEFHPCTDYDNLCQACRVFGWVYQNPPKDLEKKVAYAGRVKISHAKITENEDPPLEFTLAILSIPKPTTAYFYLLRNGKEEFSVKYDTDKAQLRGRKFYRHQEEAEKQEYKREVKDQQNRTIRDALKSGAKFQFTVEFDNLAPVELGALLWAIKLEDGMYHKLGLAKPLGFGSVKISILSIRKLDIKERYSSYAKEVLKEIPDEKTTEWIDSFKQAMRDKYGKPFEELDNIQDLKAILSKPPSDLYVNYPRTLKPGRNFEWFQQNEKYGKIPLKIAAEDTEGFPY